MKHEEATLKTRMALAASLRKYMEKKPLGKITVSEIITDCDVNRKTFYYHFEDIYALLKWMLEQEAIEVVKQFDLLVDYEDAIYFVMDYVESNAHILNCAYDSMGREQLKNFFGNDFLKIMKGLINGVEKELGLSVAEDFKNFLCCLYTDAVAGWVVSWFHEKEKISREKAVEYLTLIIRSTLPDVLKNAPKTTEVGI